MKNYMYPSGLIPAAPVEHEYNNCWIRDMWYVGICSDEKTKERIWQGIIDILDKYRWKLEIHAKQKPIFHYEHIHIRYSPCGDEIDKEWSHNQWDSIGNLIEICLDVERLDLASLLIDYLKVVKFWSTPSATAWEDHHQVDAYSLAACVRALMRSQEFFPQKRRELKEMLTMANHSLASILPFAGESRRVCLSLLGLVWPFNLWESKHEDIIDLVKIDLLREPFGCIRYEGDSWDGLNFNRDYGSEMPWLLGDLFLAKADPKNKRWKKRCDHAYEVFQGRMPEGYFPETMEPNANTPLIWAESMYQSISN